MRAYIQTHGWSPAGQALASRAARQGDTWSSIVPSLMDLVKRLHTLMVALAILSPTCTGKETVTRSAARQGARRGAGGGGASATQLQRGAGARVTMSLCSKPRGLVSFTSLTSRVTKPAAAPLAKSGALGGMRARAGAGCGRGRGRPSRVRGGRAHPPGHLSVSAAAPTLPLMRRRHMIQVSTCGRNAGKSSSAGSPISAVPAYSRNMARPQPAACCKPSPPLSPRLPRALRKGFGMGTILEFVVSPPTNYTPRRKSRRLLGSTTHGCGARRAARGQEEGGRNEMAGGRGGQGGRALRSSCWPPRSWCARRPLWASTRRPRRRPRREGWCRAAPRAPAPRHARSRCAVGGRGAAARRVRA